ncbi:MDR family MFS transporter [Streptomyces fildesensis]|uniref:MDR family MFS transporter n=1 Tax=Streptomyces fildesensis TaxID=375757 RepID=A0ABW8C961_9ACTN
MDQLITEDPTHIGPYRLIARLGAGGMGLVYLGRSEAGRTVAVKVVQAEHAQHPEFRKRFTREVAAARRVGGAWTADVLDADTEAAVPWVATQYIPGPDLHTVVAKDFGPLPEHSVRTLANRLALALQAVHEVGLIHRDLKPSNVLVTVDGPRVIDFGIARAMDSLAGDSLHTRTGMLIGSPGFMSPEQVRGLELTPASDVFCLGAVLVYATTGRLLFGATDTGLNAHLFRIAEEEADLTGVPETLVDLVRACLHKNPAERPALQQIAARTAADESGEWLPGQVLAQLGRHAAQLLDYAPAMRTAPPASAPVVPVQPLPPMPVYTPTSPADFRPAPGVGPPPAPYPGSWPAPSAPADVHGPHPRRWWGLAVITLAQLLVLINASYLDMIGPALMADLHIPRADLSLLYLAYPLAFGGLLLLGGRIADLMGRKRALIIGLVGFAAASALGGAAAGGDMLIWAMALQGVFAALLWPSALSLLTTSFTDPKERGRAFGVFGVIAGGGSAIGLLVGGWVVTQLDWRLGLFINVLIAAVAVIGAATLVHDRPGRTAVRLDVLGALLGTGGFFALTLGFNKAPAWGWTDPRVVTLLVGGVLLLAAFVWWQTRASSPFLPPYVLGDRGRLGAFLTMVLASMGLVALFLTQIFCLQDVLGYDPFRSGVALLPAVGAMVIGSTQVSARLLHRVGPRTLMVPGLALVALGVLLLTRLTLDSTYTAQVLPSMLLTGLGTGMALMPLFAIATAGTAAQDSGVASAAVNAAQQFGGLVGVVGFSGILGSAIVARVRDQSGLPPGVDELARSGRAISQRGLPQSLSKPLAEATMGGYTHTLWWVAGILLLAALVAGLLIPSTSPTSEPTPLYGQGGGRLGGS